MLTPSTLCTAGDLSFSLFADKTQEIFWPIVFGIISILYIMVFRYFRKKLNEGFEVMKRFLVMALLVILGTLKVIPLIAVIVGFLCICVIDFIENMKRLFIVAGLVLSGIVISVMYNYPLETEKSPL